MKKARARRSEYSDASFWNLVRGSFKAIGEKTLTQAFTLYFTLQDQRTPSAARLTILGALAYLALPMDLIPDFIPLAGFTDDMGAVAAAVAAVAPHIKSTHKREATKQVAELFS